MTVTTQLDQLCINTLRFLSVDIVQKASSGHPGLPLELASMAYVLMMRWLKYNPHNPHCESPPGRFTFAFIKLKAKLTNSSPYGFKATYNPTYPVKSTTPYGWVSPWHYGLNQGPIVLMIENYRTGLLWQLMRGCQYIATGLQKAGFNGGWL